MGRVLSRESLTLQPLPQNVGHARRTVFDILISADRVDLAETAALVTSEIVTNAVLHAGSEIGLTVTVTQSGVLVEVQDDSARIPAQRTYEATATTGRGMALVGALATRFGVRRIPGDGKVVWFTLGGCEPPADLTASQEPDAGATIQLTGVPVALYCAFQQMADGLLREYLLVQQQLARGDAGAADVVDWSLASRAFGELAAGGAAAFAERDLGGSSVDLTVAVQPGAASGFTALRRVLDAAVAMSARGILLAPPSQPEIVALRNWCCDEVLQQLRGARPSAWQSGRVAEVPSATPVRWDDTAVSLSAEAVVAADDANRLIAVSRSAAELLGWEPQELVGQRIVSIVPESLREAHIAGFVRYLVTGERRILGSPTQVLALRRDGTHVPVVILIEAVEVEGRMVFTATLTPVG